jgi:PHS family inorganic phosphate transporter-like MFS transporter
MANSGPPAVQHTAGGNAAFHNFHNDFAHIADPNERRRLALAEIDKAPFGWYHVRACVVAGVGFFTDSYDIFAVSLLTTMLGIVYWPQNAGVMPVSADTAIKVATSGGTVLGQLGFGALADIIGRKKMYGVELIVIIVATLAQSLSAPSQAVSIVGVIIFWRVIMGIGIGGDYPLSSIITSEFATTKWRGAMMAAVFAMQGFGQLTGGIVMLCVTAGFKGSLSLGPSIAACSGDCSLAVDKMWRVLVGFGAVPACIALYYRLTIPETPRFTFDVSRDVEQAQEDVQAYMTGKHEGQPDQIARLQALQSNTLTTPKASWGDFFRYYSKWKNGKILIGTAGSWFLLDVAFYGLNLNSTVVLGAIGWGSSKTDNVYQVLYKLAVGNVILTCAGAIPGYWFAVATIDILGRRPLQLIGFSLLTILFLVWGFDYNNISPNAMFGIYVMAQFFFNWGPNTTTFIVPGECFATRYRSTSHGISAASGKIGSIIAQAAIAPLRVTGAPAHPATTAAANPWLDNVMKIYAFFMLVGCGTTLLLPETARRTLEELSGEDGPHRVDNGVQEDLPVAKDEKTLA